MPSPFNPWAAPIFPGDTAPQPYESYSSPPVANLLSSIAGALGRAFMAPGQALQSTMPITSDQMVKPAADLAMMTTLGAGAAPQEANSLNMGIKAFHGSPNQFDQFSLSHAGSTTDAGQLGRGHYLSTDPRVMNGSPYKYEADADLTSPLNLSMPDFKTDKQTLVRNALGLPSNATAEEVTAAAKAKGHDGVILDYSPTGYKHKEIAVFDDALLKILNRQ